MKNLWDSYRAEQKAYKAQVHLQTGQEVSVEFVLPPEFFGRITVSDVGEFRPEIWKSDCLEVFLFFADGSYREWNLATDLAWWSKGFASYRKVIDASSEQAHKPKGVTLDPKSHKISWYFDCGRAVSEIKHWRACVIDKKIPEPHLLSSDKLAAEGRDFHLFSKLSLIHI